MLFTPLVQERLPDCGAPILYEASKDKLRIDTMQQEIQDLKDNNICTIVDLPPGEKKISYKWV